MDNYSLEAEIFAAGFWNDREFSQTDLEEIAANFRKYQERIKPPLKLGHREDDPRGQPALGWVKELYVKGQNYGTNLLSLAQTIWRYEYGLCQTSANAGKRKRSFEEDRCRPCA